MADARCWCRNGSMRIYSGGGQQRSCSFAIYCEMLRYSLLSFPAYWCRSLLLMSKIDFTVDGTINRHAILHHPVPFSLFSPLLSLTLAHFCGGPLHAPFFSFLSFSSTSTFPKPVLDGDGGWWELWCGRREEEGGYLSTGVLLLLTLVYLYYSSWGILLLTITPCQIIMYFWMTFGNTLCS